MTSNAPEIPETLSPFWMRLYGRWTHLEGIRPEVAVAQGRTSSELLTVDGYRYVQQAPRGPRTWTFDYEYGTAAATAALESAAYTNNYDDPETRTLLMDRNDARINMVPPELQQAWSTAWLPSSGLTKPYMRINVGSVEIPLWLPTYDAGDLVAVAPEPYTRRLRFSMIPGVEYTVAAWYAVAQPSQGKLLRVNKVVTTESTETRTEIASWTPPISSSDPENPQLGTATFTAPQEITDQNQAQGFSVTTIEVEMSMSYSAAGLMVYEGDCPPERYRAGRRTPVQVAVFDPSLTTNVIWPKECDPCALPREQSTFTIQEVGTGVVG